MSIENFVNIKDYLVSKGVKFAVKIVFNKDGSETHSFFGLNITKKGKFFRCNGVVISRNIAIELM